MYKIHLKIHTLHQVYSSPVLLRRDFLNRWSKDKGNTTEHIIHTHPSIHTYSCIIIILITIIIIIIRQSSQIVHIIKTNPKTPNLPVEQISDKLEKPSEIESKWERSESKLPDCKREHGLWVTRSRIYVVYLCKREWRTQNHTVEKQTCCWRTWQKTGFVLGDWLEITRRPALSSSTSCDSGFALHTIGLRPIYECGQRPCPCFFRFTEFCWNTFGTQLYTLTSLQLLLNK